MRRDASPVSAHRDLSSEVDPHRAPVSGHDDEAGRIWDGPDLTEHGLLNGRPAGSAVPLVWAHAEYVKLLPALRGGATLDMPPQTLQRYLSEMTDSPHSCWPFDNRIRSFPAGKPLRIGTLGPAQAHWSADGWQTTADTPTRGTRLAGHVADPPTERPPSAATVRLAFCCPQAGHVEGTDFAVRIVAEVR
jgi:glucoamylase